MGCGKSAAKPAQLTQKELFEEVGSLKAKLLAVNVELLKDSPPITEKSPEKLLRKEFDRLGQLLKKHEDDLDEATSKNMLKSDLHANNPSNEMDLSKRLSYPPNNKAEAEAFGAVNTTNASEALQHVEVDAKEDENVKALLGEENDHGLKWNTKWRGSPAGPMDEQHRNRVRNGTKRKVIEMLQLRQFGEQARFAQKMPPEIEQTTLFLDERSSDSNKMACPGNRNLLGRYDMISVRACADFDRDWNFIKEKQSRQPFWVLHAAAMNIGESAQAPDFPDFSNEKGTGLDEARYIKAMQQVYKNMIEVAKLQDCEHFIFFPFGMGAFLRHLNTLDSSYNDDSKLQNLRRQLARSFLVAFEAAPSKISLHICLQFSSDEAMRNGDAFIRAVKAAPSDTRSRVTLWPEGDCLHLAQELAQTSKAVMLVNGANRQMLGNHWFGGCAKRAIDENLHRRSWILSAVAYILNDFGNRGEIDGVVENRPADELKATVNKVGGKCLTLK